MPALCGPKLLPSGFLCCDEVFNTSELACAAGLSWNLDSLAAYLMHPFLNKCSQTLTIFKIIAVKFKLFVKFVFVSTVLPKYRWKKRSMTSISLFSCFSAGTTVYVRLNAFWKCLRFKFGNLG